MMASCQLPAMFAIAAFLFAGVNDIYMPTNPFPHPPLHPPNTPNGNNKQERDRTSTSIIAGAMFPHKDSAADSEGFCKAAACGLGWGWGWGCRVGGAGVRSKKNFVVGKKGMMVYGVVERNWAGRSRRRL